MNENNLCEADQELPNGADYRVTNCGVHEVFKFTKTKKHNKQNFLSGTLGKKTLITFSAISRTLLLHYEYILTILCQSKYRAS